MVCAVVLPRFNVNRLTTQDRARILTVLAEGMGINAACRITGASKNMVLKLMAELGRACALYQEQAMRNLKMTKVQPGHGHGRWRVNCALGCRSYCDDGRYVARYRFSGELDQSPDLPPLLASTRILPMTMLRSTALHMS